jgi:hypothetical protein
LQKPTVRQFHTFDGRPHKQPIVAPHASVLLGVHGD